MGVDGHEGVVPGGLLDRGPHLGLGQLGRAGDAAAGQDRAGPEALDQVGATDEQPSDPLAHLVDGASRRRIAGPSGSSMSWARPTTSPPPHGAVMNAPGRLHPRPDHVAPVDGVAQGAALNARNEPTSRTVVNPASIVWRAWRTPMSTSSPPTSRRRHARRLDVADEVGVRVDEPGQDVTGRRGRRPARRRGCRPPAAAMAVTRPSSSTCTTRSTLDLPRLDVEQPPDADGRRHVTLMRASARPIGSNSGSGWMRAGRRRPMISISNAGTVAGRVGQRRRHVAQRDRLPDVMAVAAGGDPADDLVAVPDRLVADDVGRVVRIGLDDEGHEPPLRPGRDLLPRTPPAR